MPTQSDFRRGMNGPLRRHLRREQRQVGRKMKRARRRGREYQQLKNQQQAIRDVLADPRKMDELADRIRDDQSPGQQALLLAAVSQENGADAKGSNRLSDRPLLRWLWENRMEILRLVLLIAGLFGAGVPVI